MSSAARSDLTPEERADLLDLLDEAKRAIDARFAPQPYNIGVNDGPVTTSLPLSCSSKTPHASSGLAPFDACACHARSPGDDAAWNAVDRGPSVACCMQVNRAPGQVNHLSRSLTPCHVGSG